MLLCRITQKFLFKLSSFGTFCLSFIHTCTSPLDVWLYHEHIYNWEQSDPLDSEKKDQPWKEIHSEAQVSLCVLFTRNICPWKCPYFHFHKRLWNMTAILEQEIISSWDQLNACACIMYDVCVRGRKRDTAEGGGRAPWLSFYHP